MYSLPSQLLLFVFERNFYLWKQEKLLLNVISSYKVCIIFIKDTVGFLKEKEIAAALLTFEDFLYRFICLDSYLNLSICENLS